MFTFFLFNRNQGWFEKNQIQKSPPGFIVFNPSEKPHLKTSSKNLNTQLRVHTSLWFLLFHHQ